jgi:hypothetical protein
MIRQKFYEQDSFAFQGALRNKITWISGEKIVDESESGMP